MLAFLFAATLATATQTEPRPAAHTTAEACLRENVGAAVGVSSGASDAAMLLLDYLCAGPVSAAVRYDANLASLNRMKALYAQMAAMRPPEVELITPDAEESEDGEEDFDPSDVAASLEGVSIDPVTGEIVTLAGSEGATAALIMQMSTAGELRGEAPAFLRELAGRLVVEIRGRP